MWENRLGENGGGIAGGDLGTAGFGLEVIEKIMPSCWGDSGTSLLFEWLLSGRIRVSGT